MLQTIINDKKEIIENFRAINSGQVLLENVFKVGNLSENKDELLLNKLSINRYEKLEKPIIFIGLGTCGLGAGAAKTKQAIQKYLQINEIDADLVEVGCIGLCALEPIVDVQLPGRTRISFNQVTLDRVNDILDNIFEGIVVKKNVLGQFKNDTLQEYSNVGYIEDHPFFSLQTRWVLQNCGKINPIRIEEYIANGGYRALIKTLTKHTPDEVCAIIEKSGLRGRGGAGFPTGKKWRFALNEQSKQKYLICNADEGDPGAFMDRAVIEGDPYRLLEGMTIAAYAIGASKAYVYIRAEYPLAIERLKIALEKTKFLGLLGENILDSGFNLEIVIKKGAGAFVCGEETALIHSIEGKRGMPKPRPPYPAVSGLFGKPTVINNVETLSNVAEIIARGDEWFSSIGTQSSKGTKVFALSGNINLTGLVEVNMGMKLRDIIYKIGDGCPYGRKFKAVQIGGPSGGCIPESHLDIDIDYESLKTVGAMMGSGGLVVMDETSCMVDVAKYFMDFIQRESCGKCIPCREGTKRMLEILQQITGNEKEGRRRKTLERFQSVMNLKNLSQVINETSLCGLGKSAPNPVLSTLKWFRDEYEEHIYDRKCRAKVCKELIEFSINQENCTGCTLCAKSCPSDCIMGNLKSPHYIITEKCIGCGGCLDVCHFNAVEVA